MGFEPTVRVNVHLISNQAPSTTRPPLQGKHLATFLTKERVKQLLRGVLAGALNHLKPMSLSSVIADLVEATDAASTWVSERVDDPGNPCLHQRACAHRTGLKGDVEGRVIEAPATASLRGLLQREDLGVCERVIVDDPPVMPTSDDFVIGDDDSTDRYVVVFQRKRSLVQRVLHPPIVVCWRLAGLHRLDLIHVEYTRQDSNLKPSVP